MHRTRFLPLAFALVVVALVGASPALLDAQEEPDVAYNELDGSGLRYRALGEEAGFGGRSWETYSVSFAPTAALPEVRYPESLVVLVEAGALAFRPGQGQGGDERVEDPVVIDPRGNETVPVLGTVQDLSAPTYPVLSDIQFNRVLEDQSGDCTTLCVLADDTLREGEAVLLQEGDTVFIPSDSVCFFCNVTEIRPDLPTGATPEAGSGATPAASLEATPADSDDPLGEGEARIRLVASVEEGQTFSWTQLNGIEPVGGEEASTGSLGGGPNLFPASDLPGAYIGCR